MERASPKLANCGWLRHCQSVSTRYRARVFCMDHGGQELASATATLPPSLDQTALVARVQKQSLDLIISDHSGCDHIETVCEPAEDW